MFLIFFGVCCTESCIVCSQELASRLEKASVSIQQHVELPIKDKVHEGYVYIHN